jgi:Type II CAAX prenyl endopeptidase Rce1-like
MYEAAVPRERGIRDYLREPTPSYPGEGRRRGPEFFRLLGLCLLIALATGPLTAVVSAVGDADNRLDDVAPLVVVILGVLAAPVLEELTFRLPLGPLRPWWLLVSALCLGSVDPRLGLAALVVAVTVVACRPLRRAAVRFWAERFPAVFFGSAVAFGLLHVTNWHFGRPLLAFVMLPLLVLPQGLIGVVLGYTRVRMGLRWSMLLHATYNGTVLGLAALLSIAAAGN